MYSVYQHWDPLKVCVVGRSYPPEFYSWINVPHVRSLFEKIAIETEEDYQNIITKLQEFGVEVFRPDISTDTFVQGKFLPPPMTPRDYMVMIGSTFYKTETVNFQRYYNMIKDQDWPECSTIQQFYNLPSTIQQECIDYHAFLEQVKFYTPYDQIFESIEKSNLIKPSPHPYINGAGTTRIGKDLYFGTSSYNEDTTLLYEIVNNEFVNTRNHVINTGGHADGTYCPVCPGLIISLNDVPTYADTFPDWEVVYLPNQSWNKVGPFLNLKKQNRGKWWIPGFEYDQDVINVVESWLGHWTGYVEETVFDVNMLIIDPKNVMVFNYNKQVFDALDRYGITAHIVPFRHRYFWDGGIHCVTTDLHREGTMQNYFSQRG
jgi:hypothetical protein